MDVFQVMLNSAKTATFNPVKDRREAAKRQRLENEEEMKVEREKKMKLAAEEDRNSNRQGQFENLIKKKLQEGCKNYNLIHPSDVPPSAVFEPEKKFIGLIGEIDYRIGMDGRPILRCFVTQHSTNAAVQIQITGLLPYFYMQIPKSWQNNPKEMEMKARLLKKAINLALPQKPKYKSTKPVFDSIETLELEGDEDDYDPMDDDEEEDDNAFENKNVVHSVQIVSKDSIKNYLPFEQGKNKCFKINFFLPKDVLKVRKLLLTSFAQLVPGVDPSEQVQLFECNVPFVTRAMVDKSFVGFGWLSLEAGTYKRNADRNGYSQTTSSLELIVEEKNASFIACEGEWAQVPVLRTISFDIECACKKHFPQASKDPVVNIVARLSKQFNNNNKTDESTSSVYAFCLDDCSAIPEATKVFTYPILPRLQGKATEHWNAILATAQKDGHTLPDRANIIIDKAISNLTVENKAHKESSMWASQASKLLVQVKTILTPHKKNLGDVLFLQTLFNNYKPGPGFRNTQLFQTFQKQCECDMLKDFIHVMHQLSPHLLTGYNIADFDIRYLVERGKAIGCKEINYWGSSLEPISIREIMFSSRGTGSMKKFEIKTPGWIIFDMHSRIRADHKMDSYTLNAVSAKFLKKQKDEVDHKDIYPLWVTNTETRRRLLKYCIKDTLLPQELMINLQKLTNSIEMCRAVGLTLSEMNIRGKQAQVFSKILREALARDLVIPFISYADNNNNNNNSSTQKEKFAGAVVIEPKRGLYKGPVVTLDFTSLYPTIIIAYNLCYSTKIPTFEQAMELAKILQGGWNDIHVLHIKRRADSKAKQIIISDLNKDGKFLPLNFSLQDLTKCNFVLKAHIKEGLLPQIEKDLLARRNSVKKLIKGVPIGSDAAAILDGKQLALKIVANSVYGFTGAQTFPDFDIAEIITEVGTQLINVCKTEAEGLITKKNGYKDDVQVIYGDTDSCMLYLGASTTLEEAMKIGPMIAEQITQKCPKYTKLEFEKVYMPYLLLNKKRYLAYKWELGKSKCEFDFKGIELARRGYTAYLKRMMKVVIQLILDMKLEEAKKVAIQGARDLLKGEVENHELIMSASISQAEYKNPPAHVRLAEVMKKRNPETAPTVGDRMQIVFKLADSKAKQWDRIEDSFYAIQNGTALDYRRYFERQYRLPMGRLFAFLLFPNEVIPNTNEKETKEVLLNLSEKAANQLFDAVSKSVRAPIFLSAHDPLSRYLKKVQNCVGCKTKMHNGKGICCSSCEPDKPRLYTEHIAKIKQVQDERKAIWNQCTECRGELPPEECGNYECPTLFKRVELENKQKKLEQIKDMF